MIWHHKPFKWEYETQPHHKMIFAVDVDGKFAGFVWVHNRMEAASKLIPFGQRAKIYGLPVLWNMKHRKAREA